MITNDAILFALLIIMNITMFVHFSWISIKLAKKQAEIIEKHNSLVNRVTELEEVQETSNETQNKRINSRGNQRTLP